MINPSLLKQVIVENELAITQTAYPLLSRERIFFPKNLNKIIAIYGVRRSGKTHLLYKLFQENPGQALYIDFEDERLEGFTAQDFQSLLESFYELNPKRLDKGCVLLLDEIQNVKGWEKFCRRVAERSQLKVYVSGSSSQVMPLEIQTTLRGRSWGIELLPFSFREYGTSQKLSLSDPKTLYSTQRAKIKSTATSYIKWGGFPEISLLQNEAEKSKVLHEYLEAMFFKDLVERFQTKNIALMEALNVIIFSGGATQLSLQSVYKQLKDKIPLSKDSLYEYYHYFEKSLLLFEVKIFSRSTYQRMRNPPKIYLVDNGLFKKLASQDWGRLLENMVYLELRRRYSGIHYFQGKKECDFIVENRKGDFEAYQVCYELTSQNRNREIEGLLEALKAIGLKKGKIICLDEEDRFQQEGRHIEILPFWKWALQ